MASFVPKILKNPESALIEKNEIFFKVGTSCLLYGTVLF
jgi:hypothetical protein